MKLIKKHTMVACFVAGSFGIATAGGVNVNDGLDLVSEIRISSDTKFDGVPFGGISGLDHVKGNTYIALSDDRSEKGDARFYDLTIDGKTVTINGVTTIQTADGGAYAKKTVDPEAIRYENGMLYWTSEIDSKKNPMLRKMGMDGKDQGAFDLPKKLFSTGKGNGHVSSASLEALAQDGNTLYAATENALQQDGPKASGIASSPSRIYQINKKTGVVEAEYVYVVDSVSKVSQLDEKPWSDNGLSELYSLGNGQFISVERNGWHVGGFEFHFNIKAYLVDINGATDVKDHYSLAALGYPVANRVQPAKKTLLVDFAELGLESVDNIEAIALGPVIDGEQTIIFASDNNFDGRQTNQFVIMK